MVDHLYTSRWFSKSQLEYDVSESYLESINCGNLLTINDNDLYDGINLGFRGGSLPVCILWLCKFILGSGSLHTECHFVYLSGAWSDQLSFSRCQSRDRRHLKHDCLGCPRPSQIASHHVALSGFFHKLFSVLCSI